MIQTPGSYTISLFPGKYRIECWGAQGGFVEHNESGRGAYVSGEINFPTSINLYLYIGSKGSKNSNSLSFNGGGAAYHSNDIENTKSYSCSGGGSTDVRLISEKWDNLTSLLSRIIVAAGGGGEVKFEKDNSLSEPGGSGGTIIGESGNFSHWIKGDKFEYQNATGGSQNEGGKGGGGNMALGNNGGFGYGGSAVESSDSWPSSGGGSGYFGGGSGGVSPNNLGVGAGGSSYVSGYENCSSVEHINDDGEFSFKDGFHISGYFFTNLKMKTGNQNFLSPDGKEEIGHFGDGAIKITTLKLYINSKYKSKKCMIFHIYRK